MQRVRGCRGEIAQQVIEKRLSVNAEHDVEERLEPRPLSGEGQLPVVVDDRRCRARRERVVKSTVSEGISNRP